MKPTQGEVKKKLGNVEETVINLGDDSEDKYIRFA